MKKETNFEPERLEEAFDMIFGNGLLFAVAIMSMLLLIINVFL